MRRSDPCQHVGPQGHGLPAPGDGDDVVQSEVAPVDDAQLDLLLRRGGWFISTLPDPSGQVQWPG